MPLDNALIILRGQKVLKVEKYDYTLHPDAKKLTIRKASDHVPKWRMNGIAEESIYMPHTKSPVKKPGGRKKQTIMQAEPEISPVIPDFETPSASIPDDEPWMDAEEIIPLDKNSIMS